MLKALGAQKITRSGAVRGERTTRVSLILATVGRCDDVGRCLDALLAQTAPNIEVILVDQNEDDRLLPHVDRARIGGLRLLHLHLLPPSLSNARNLGLTFVTGQIVGFPDDDCWYEPDAVAQIVAAFDAEPQRAGLVANWVEQSAGCHEPAAGRLDAAAWRRFRGGHASSISLFFRYSVFETLGGFDVRLGVGRFYGAAEETDLLMRALSHDLWIDRWPLARIHHPYGLPPSGSFLAQWKSLRRRARGTGALYTKHHLNAFVRLRGFLAPCINALRQGSGLAGFVKGLAISLGRIEGMVAWSFEESKGYLDDA